MIRKIALEEHFAIDLTIDQSKIYALPMIWEKLKAGLIAPPKSEHDANQPPAELPKGAAPNPVQRRNCVAAMAERRRRT